MINILNELNLAWKQADLVELENLVDFILRKKSNSFVGLGAGRMGYSLQSFIMRLSHLGLKSFMIGDTTVPRINENSVVLINSSSGETESIKLYAQQAKDAGSSIVLFTSNLNSSISKLSDIIIYLPKIETKQIMKTIYEQYSFLLFDHLVMMLINKLKLDKELIETNHSILE